MERWQMIRNYRDFVAYFSAGWPQWYAYRVKMVVSQLGWGSRIELAFLRYAQAQRYRRLQIQSGFLNRLLILSKHRIFLGGFKKNFRPHFCKRFWLAGQTRSIPNVANIAILRGAQARKIRQLQNQNTFLFIDRQTDRPTDRHMIQPLCDSRKYRMLYVLVWLKFC